MPKLGFPNCFIVNNIKQNVAQVLPTKSCVTWWLRHLDCHYELLGSNSHMVKHSFGAMCYNTLLCDKMVGW